MIWDAKKLNLIIALENLSPSGQDSHVKIERMTPDLVTTQNGVKGDANISEVYDDRHKLTIVNLGSDPNNAKLDKLAKARKSFSVLLEDKSTGGELGFSAKARVMTPAIYEKGKEYKDKTWVIVMIDYKGATLE